MIVYPYYTEGHGRLRRYLYSEVHMPTIRLPEEIENHLDALARKTGRSKTFYAREAMLEHLDELEDLYLAEQQMVEVWAGRLKTIPLEDVVK